MTGTQRKVEILQAITVEDAADLHRLLKQLSTTAEFDVGRVESMITHDATDMLVVRDQGRIVGMATMVTFPLPTGNRGIVEDVAVDESMRGQGIARLLLQQMTRIAGERDLRTLDLTSRPSREAALRLYESVGFVRRETNVLRYTPEV